MHYILTEPSITTLAMVFSFSFVLSVTLRGLIIRLRKLPHHEYVIRLKVGDRIVDYDPKEVERSNAILTEAITEGDLDGTRSR